MRARAASMSTLFMAVACMDSARMDSARVNAMCSWNDPSTAPLDLRRATDREHLRIDAQLAGELGQRLADVRFRNRPDLGDPIQQRCTAELQDTIAQRHRVSLADVRKATTDRVWWADLLVVYLPLVLLVGLAMDRVTQRIGRAFDPEDRAMATAAVVFLVPITALFGLGVGQFWGFTVEGWFLRNEHVAFRAFLVPIIRHGWIAFFTLLALCTGVAAARFRRMPLRKDRPGYAARSRVGASQPRTGG